MEAAATYNLGPNLSAIISTYAAFGDENDAEYWSNSPEWLGDTARVLEYATNFDLSSIAIKAVDRAENYATAIAAAVSVGNVIALNYALDCIHEADGELAPWMLNEVLTAARDDGVVSSDLLELLKDKFGADAIRVALEPLELSEGLLGDAAEVRDVDAMWWLLENGLIWSDTADTAVTNAMDEFEGSRPRPGDDQTSFHDTIKLLQDFRDAADAKYPYR